MESVVHDMLAFYQRELLEGENAGRIFLEREGLLNEDLLKQIGMGFSTGRLLEVAGSWQKSSLKKLRLIQRGREAFIGSLVLPVHDENGELLDLYGLCLRSTDIRARFWKAPLQGILGSERVGAYRDVIVCEYAIPWLHVLKGGHINAVSMRGISERDKLVRFLADHKVQSIQYLGRKWRKAMGAAIGEAGIEVSYLPLSHHGHRPSSKVRMAPSRPADHPVLTRETEESVYFQAGEVRIRVDASAIRFPTARVLVRAEREQAHVLDKVDFSSSRSRAAFAQLAAPRLGLASPCIEEHLAGIADLLDRTKAESQKEAGEMSESERAQSMKLVETADLLKEGSRLLEDHLGFVGEEENRKLGVLIAASRLVPEPIGGIVRGSAGSGKSTLLKAVSQLLPCEHVLLFSRLTPQALYFLPEEVLLHRLLVVDEYEGMEESEYALRTMMSNQMLSLAITIREGGRLPVTRSVNRQARLAVLVSTTGVVNLENLSRFLELRLDASHEQSRRVMAGATAARGRSSELAAMQNGQRLLRPCEVRIPFAHEIMPGGTHVLVRRRHQQILSLIKSHAALHQYQRARSDKEGMLVVEATDADYAAVRPLLGFLVDHAEEDLSPAAMRLLDYLHSQQIRSFVREDAMRWLGCSYSTAYRTLKELEGLELVQGDHSRNGIKRTYAVGAYHRTESGVSILPEATKSQD